MSDLKNRSLDDRHIEAAGRALKELKKLGDTQAAQVSIALMALYLCSQNEILMEDFVTALMFNIKGIGTNPEFMMEKIEEIHKAIEPTIISVPNNYNPIKLDS